MIALAQHQLGMRDLQVGMECRAGRPLHAMVRPQESAGRRAPRSFRMACRPGWAEANDRWPGGCQSCVSTTCSKPRAELVDRAARPHRRAARRGCRPDRSRSGCRRPTETSLSPIVRFHHCGTFHAAPSGGRPRPRAAPGRPPPAPGKMRLRLQADATARAAARDRGWRARGCQRASAAGRYGVPVSHDQLDQGLARLIVALDRENIAGHAAVRPVAAPDLLAARPGRLAGRALAPRQPGIFLKLVGAVERRHVGRSGQAGADAEAVDRRAGSEHLARARPRRVRRWRRCVTSPSPPASRMLPHALGERDEIAAVQPHAADRDARAP